MKMEQDPRFRHLEALVGTFVVGAVIAIIVTIMYFGTDFNIFAKKYSLYFVADTGTGLNKGMPVKIAGFLVGRVQEVSLDDRAKVLVRLRVDRKYSKWIRADSVATLMQEGLLGTSIIDISVGSAEFSRLKKGEDERRYIRFRRQEALNDIALGLRDSVDKVLVEVHKTISYINDPQGDIKMTLANIEQLTAGLEETRKKSDRLILAGAESAGKAATLIDNLTVMANNLSTVVDNTNRRLPALMDNVEKVLANVENSSMQARNMIEQAAPRVGPILLETEELVSNTNAVVSATKRMWPLRNHIPANDKPGIIPGDSYE